MSRVHEVPVYLQITRPRYGYSYGGRWISAVARRLTVQRPEQPLPGAVVVKLTLRIPDEAFEPLRPQAVIDIPADLIQRPVQVEANDP